MEIIKKGIYTIVIDRDHERRVLEAIRARKSN